MIKSILCKIIGHKFHPTSIYAWHTDGTNFICERCKKRVKNYKDTIWKNKNKVIEIEYGEETNVN